MGLEYTFDADIDSVFALICDPDFLVDRCLALGELSAECEVTESGADILVSMAREVEPKLPAVARKLFDPVQTVRLEERWCEDAHGYSGRYRLEMIGQPVTVNAQMSLRRSGTGSLYRIDHECKARIPLIGRHVEQFMLRQTSDGAQRELQYLSEFLAA